MRICFFEQYWTAHFDLIFFIKNGFLFNRIFWKLILAGKGGHAFYYLCDKTFNYMVGFPLFMTGLLSVIALIPNNPHKVAMATLKRGEHQNGLSEISDKSVQRIEY